MSLAITSYGTAKGFCQCAYLVMANPHRLQLPDDRSFVLGFHHLIGFAVELYLKAFLLHQGISEEQLRSKEFGHKMQKLLSTANSSGLTCNSAEVLCTYLAKHETFEYRYMREDARYDLLSLDKIFHMLSDLDIRVDQEIGASISYGRAPGGGWTFPEDGKKWRIPNNCNTQSLSN